MGCGVYSLRHTPRLSLARLLKIEKAPRWDQVQVVKTDQEEDLRLDTLRLESPAGGTAAYLLVSQKSLAQKDRLPAIVLIHGHFSDAKEFIQKLPDASLWPLGKELARQGFVVLAPQMRYETANLKEETRQAAQLLLQGKTLMGERVADVLRCVDYLSAHALVDPAKIGILGWSMGGNIALFAGALEPRVKVLYVSGSAGSLRVALLPQTPLQTADNYVPNLLPEFGDKARLISLIYPRPILIEHGSNDPSDPGGGVLLTLEKVEPLYKNYPKNLHVFWHLKGHRLDGSKAVEWFTQWLK